MTPSSSLCPGCFLQPADTLPCPGCGWTGERGFPTALEPGSILAGKYEVGRVLGQPGGFGVTYLTYDLRLQRRIALKELMPRELVARAPDGATLHPHSQSDAEVFRYTLESFLNEARLLARFSHPNLVRVLDYFEGNGTAYFAMEFYEGSTLAEIAKERGTLSGEEVVEIARPLLGALDQVHEAGILHRDIKPTNIYVTRDGRPVLLDFGAARQTLERSRSLTSVLTPGYAPFEQYHGQGNQGPWTDVYGVAATLYFLVTGQGPPEAGARVQAGHLVVPPHELAPDLSPEMSRAILAGLEVEPGDRPQSAGAFLAMLAGAAPTAGAAAGDPAGGTEDHTVVVGAAGATGPSTAAPRATAPPTAPIPPSPSPSAQDPPAPREGERRSPVSPAWMGAAVATVVIALAIPLAASWFGGSEVVGGPDGAAAPGLDGATGAAEDATGAADGGSVAAGAGAPDGTGAADGGEAGAAASGGDAGDPGAGAADPPVQEERPPPSPPAPGNGVAVILVGSDDEAVRSAETVLLGAVTPAGSTLRVVDAGTLRMMRENAAEVRSAVGGDPGALAEIAARRGIEFLVIGNLSASAEPTRDPFWGARADLDMRLYRVSTRSLAGSATFRAGSEQLVAGRGEAGALRAATRAVGEEAAQAVRGWIADVSR